MKLGKHERSKQRCQDLHWKVHDRAKCFVLIHYAWLHNQNVSVLLVECDRLGEGSSEKNCCW